MVYRKCRLCNLEANSEEDLIMFVTNSTSKYGKVNECKECNNIHRKIYRETDSRQAASRKSHLKKTYGLTIEEYENMFIEQEGRCAICGSEDSFSSSPHFHVDHCHTTGNVRGLLCGPCNQGLGQFKDNLGSLYSAINYLEQRPLRR